MFDFGANKTLATLESVPEQFQPLYKETEAGGFELSTEPTVVGAVEAILGLHKALTASRAEAKDYKGRAIDLGPLSSYGATIEEISAGMTTKIDEMESQIAKGKGADLDLGKLKEALAKTHAEAIAAKDVKVGSLEGQLHKELVTNRATAALASQKGNLELLMPHINNHVKAVSNEAGQYEVHVVDAEGTRRFSGVTGVHMTIEELVTEMKGDKKFGVCFDSEAPQGGGARPPGPAAVTLPTDKMNSQQKISAGLAKRGVGR